MRIKDILKLRQKEAISGAEKIPVSKDEYVTIDQINEEVKKDIDGTLQDYIKKTDRLILGGYRPADLIDNNN